MLDEATVLVVDDRSENLKVATETLASHGYKVISSISGERALKRLQKNIPDLILLDIQMPGIDGFETCRQIKRNPSWAHIPVIFLTAQTDAESIVKGFSLGAVDYLSKPFRAAELIARVNTHWQLHQMTHRLEQQVSERTQALKATMEQLQTSQLQLVQQEKMSALGDLVAGVAHEINNPIGFVQGNTQELQQNLSDIFAHLSLYKQQASPQDIEDHANDIDIEFLLEDMPKMLTSMLKGCDRIRSISTSLRTFSRSDKDTKVTFDLHEGIDSTLLILKYRLKDKEDRPAIEIIKNYGNIPSIECFPGQLNQVFMNLIANAIDMFDEAAENKPYKTLKANPQQITIHTRLVESVEQTEVSEILSPAIEICISDNGKGMSTEICTRIFDREFTTKAVGKGTGLGLAIAQQIIVNHNGTIQVQSSYGEGTQFIVTLPCNAPRLMDS